jgi:hypothetical protein
LRNANDFMRPVNGSARVLAEVLNEDLPQLIQRQADHAVGMIHDRLHADPGEPRPVKFPPADTVWGKTAGTNVVNDASLDQFLDGRGGVVSCSGLSIQLVAHVNEIDFDSFLCESETEEKSRRTSTDDDHLDAGLIALLYREQGDAYIEGFLFSVSGHDEIRFRSRGTRL